MYPFERFTEEAKKVLTLAQEEAERGHHPYIGTEHLLLGLMRGDGPGAQALQSLQISIESVRNVIETALGRSEKIPFQQVIPTSRVKKVIELSFQESSRLGHQYVDSGHMLVGLMLEGEGIAAHALADLGATTKQVTEAVKTVRKHSPGPAVAPLDVSGMDTETLLALIQTPRLTQLLESRGLDIQALEQLLIHPPEPVVTLRRSVAHLREELKRKAADQDFEAAARLQRGEKELLTRLAAAEKEWIDGL